jgi:hypothetical protein
VNAIFQPHPGAQTRFMQFKGRYALFGGAKGGGKSQCLLYDPFRQIFIEQERVNRGEIRQSTGRAIFFRRTMPELREVMDRAHRTFPLIDPAMGEKGWHEQTKTWTFSCGYKYMFGQMEEPGDWTKYYGTEFTEVIFDELTLFTEEQYDQIDTCLRSTDPVLRTMLYMRAGTNPVGAGRDWVRRRFVECAPPNTPVIRRVNTPVVENGETTYVTVEHQQIFIPAKVSDNPSVDQAQYASILAGKSATVRRQLLEGDWYAGGEGAWVGDDWDSTVHIIKPFPLPRGWPKFRSGDYGYSWPGLASIGWWAVDTDGNFTCYRSLTTTRQNSEMLAYRIKEIEMDAGEWDVERGCSKLTGPLDSSCWAKTGTVGPSIAEMFFQVGVIWEPSDKDRHLAAEQFRIRLVRRTAHPTLRDEDKKPLYVVPGIRFFNTCYSYVKNPKGERVKVGPVATIPILASDETDPDVPDTKGNDHDWDMSAYACLYRQISAVNDRNPPDELAELKKRQQKAERGHVNRLGYPTGAW